MTFISATACKYSYSFGNVTVSDAIVTISKDNPDVNISFIYKELDNYKASHRICADNIYEALSQLVGLNPVSVIKRDDNYYIEALQHGKYCYIGKTIDSDNEPVVAATVMLLSPRDSTVITYGITDNAGRFSIPCDRQSVIGKFSCVGYETDYQLLTSFNVGTIAMKEKTINLAEAKVEADNAHLYADKSVYLPTAKQKNASQTGGDLLNHMAIPQLGISMNNIQTNSGKPVAVFIDFVPASEEDLVAMRVADVKRVEFYEHPSDPRLLGNQYAVNFVMQAYEMGGYFKGFAHTNLISNQVGEALGNLRVQYKKMTYDIMGSALHYDRKNIGSELTETFRLPQDNGSVEEFKRHSDLQSAKEQMNWYFATLRATYNSDKVQAVSQFSGRIDKQPDTQCNGMVTYSTGVFPTSEYHSSRDDRSKFVSYKGYYYFTLSNDNSLTFTPQYSFSHTVQNTIYEEQGFEPIYNAAADYTSQASAALKYKHSFGKFGSLLGLVKGSYEHNHTRYSGSAIALDRANSSRIGVAANYDVTVGNFYGQMGFGWNWDRLQFGDMTDKPSSPYFDLSLQYALSKRHSISANFEYDSWLPSPSYKSDKIIEASPLLSYTGNPNLVPAKSYDFELSYTWIPSNDYSFGAYAWAWIVDDRYVYDYEATSSGVLRTIKQPMGSFAQGKYGINGTLRFFDRSLVLSGAVGQLLNHNGKPYNVNHSYIDWHARVRYYLNDWNFTFTFISDNASADGCMNGIWHKSKNDWYVTVVWSNDKWNVRGDIINFTRWNWRNSRREMRSQYYDTDEILINGLNRAFIQLSATFTFGFGKKVERSDQPSVSGSASSGILK